MTEFAATFAAGFVSIAFPCVLPLVPGYLSAVSEVEPGRLGTRDVARRVVVASLPFIAGFTIVFVSLGAAARAISGVVDGTTQQWIAGFVLVVAGLALAGVLPASTQQEIAGFILVVAGLALVGLLPGGDRLVAPGLVGAARRRRSRVLLGGAFAVCAAPCVGPLLGSALAAASQSSTVVRGSALLAAYSVGLGAAFVLVAIFFARGMSAFRWVRDHYRAFSVAGGTVLVGIGLLLFFDRFWWLQSGAERMLSVVGIHA